MTLKDLSELETAAYKNIDRIKREQENYLCGVEEGINIMFKAVRERLIKEKEKTAEEATKERTCRNCKNLKEINGGCKHCVTSTDPFTGKLNPPSHWQPIESEGTE
jgi:hypothetical protein